MTAWVPVDKAAKEPCPKCQGEMSVFGRKALCPTCGVTYQREKPRRSSRLVVELTDTDVARMLAHALRQNPRDFAILGFLASGFRRSEVVGGDEKMVELPGIHTEDILLDQQGVRVVGKGQSPAIREGREPRRVLQPVPRVFLEAALSRGFEKGPLFEDMNTHQVGDMVKEYARLAAVPEWEEVRAHRLRHWYSNAIRKRIGNQGPTALLEWADTMRHSRKAAQSVTVAFYSGELTSFERRLEICLAAFQPVLEQLQSPTFLQTLPAPALLPIRAPRKIDVPSVRVLMKTKVSEKGADSERETGGIPPILRIESKTTADVRESKEVTAPSEGVSPVEVETMKPEAAAPVDPPTPETVDEPPLTKSPHVAPPENSIFSGYGASDERGQVENSGKIVYYTKGSLDTVEDPAVETNPVLEESLARSVAAPEPRGHPSQLDIVLAWQNRRRRQRSEVERLKLWKKIHCTVPGCKHRIVARDETGWVCDQHCPTLHDPPEGWLPRSV